MTLNGKRIVVLGGSSGIGLATAQAAVRERASVVIASSRQARVDEALATLPGAEGHAVDLTDAAAVEGFFKRIGPFDHLVFTAGETLQLGTLASTDLETARQFFTLRYFGAYLAAKYGSGSIRPGGSIVFTSGIAGQRPRVRLGSGGEHHQRHGGADQSAGGGTGADPGQHRVTGRGEDAAVVGHGGGRSRGAVPRDGGRAAVGHVGEPRRSPRPICI